MDETQNPWQKPINYPPRGPLTPSDRAIMVWERILRLDARRRTEWVQRRLDHPDFDPNLMDSRGLTLIGLVVYALDVDLLNRFVSRGCPPDVPDGVGVTPLFAVVSLPIRADHPPDALAQKFAIMERLLTLGANPMQRSSEGSTLLHAALHEPAVLQILLPLFVDLGARNYLGWTALEEAKNDYAMFGAAELVESIRLLESGESIRRVAPW